MICTNIASLLYVVVPLTALLCGPYDRPVLASIRLTVEAAGPADPCPATTIVRVVRGRDEEGVDGRTLRQQRRRAAADTVARVLITTWKNASSVGSGGIVGMCGPEPWPVPHRSRARVPTRAG